MGGHHLEKVSHDGSPGLPHKFHTESGESVRPGNKAKDPILSENCALNRHEGCFKTCLLQKFNLRNLT